MNNKKVWLCKKCGVFEIGTEAPVKCRACHNLETYFKIGKTEE